jgi:hypothetical protein
MNETSDNATPGNTSYISTGSQEIARPNRFYCQEEDCGRGFSTKEFLSTHTKFFHPKKVRIFWGAR